MDNFIEFAKGVCRVIRGLIGLVLFIIVAVIRRRK